VLCVCVCGGESVCVLWLDGVLFGRRFASLFDLQNPEHHFWSGIVTQVKSQESH